MPAYILCPKKGIFGCSSEAAAIPRRSLGSRSPARSTNCCGEGRSSRIARPAIFRHRLSYQPEQPSSAPACAKTNKHSRSPALCFVTSCRNARPLPTTWSFTGPMDWVLTTPRSSIPVSTKTPRLPSLHFISASHCSRHLAANKTALNISSTPTACSLDRLSIDPLINTTGSRPSTAAQLILRLKTAESHDE